MDVAQADPSFLGNAAVPPGLSAPWAACSVRTHCRRHGKATTPWGSFPRARPAAKLWGSLYPQGSKTTAACSALPLSAETSSARCVPVTVPYLQSHLGGPASVVPASAGHRVLWLSAHQLRLSEMGTVLPSCL